jgi:hypothetical protein
VRKIASHQYRPAARAELIAAMRTSFQRSGLSVLKSRFDLDQGLLAAATRVRRVLATANNSSLQIVSVRPGLITVPTASSRFPLGGASRLIC